MPLKNVASSKKSQGKNCCFVFILLYVYVGFWHELGQGKNN